MQIVKNKKAHNSFDIKGLTAGKLMAIQAALELDEKNGTITQVGNDVLQLLNQERKNFING